MCQSDRRGFCFVIVAQVVFAGGSLQAQDAALAKQVTSFKSMASKALLASGVVNPLVGLVGWVGAIESAGQTEANWKRMTALKISHLLILMPSLRSHVQSRLI